MKNKHIQGMFAKGKILLLGICLFNTSLFSQVNSACFNSHNDNAFVSASSAQGFDVADFNNDGKLDLAYLSFLTTGNLLTIKLGNGNGTFQANTTYNVGARPFAIRAKDLDADGDIDLAISNQTFSTSNARISVLFNNGSGAFGTVTSYSGSIPGPAPSAPNMFELDVNDVTGDGLVDIVVAVNNGFEVFTNLGGAPAIFQSPTFTNATNNSARGLIVANFDGLPGNDVVTANYGIANFSLRTNNGSGVFNTAVNFTCSSNPIDIATADFDNDGDLDIVTANEASDQISIFLNNGSGNFGTQTVLAAGDAPSAIKCGDVNNDGNVDIIVTNGNSNTLSICNGNGNGTFQAKYEIIAIATPKNLVVGDFDADSKMDVITSTQTQGVSQFFKGSASGLTDLGINYSTNSIVKHLTSTDLNNDGKNDILVANGTLNNFDVYFSLGNAVYNPVPSTYSIPGSNNPTYIQSNFLNNADTDKDVAVYYAGSTKLTVFNGSPSGILTSFASFTPGAAVNSFAFEQLVGVTTNKDFVLARTDGQIEIRENDGTTSFPVFQTLSTGASSISYVTVKDVNNDGFNDIITANGTSNTISVFLYNSGSNNFNSAVTLSTPASSTPIYIEVKDLNNDNFADIVSANSGTSGGFSRFLNNGSGGFGTIQSSSGTGSSVKAVHIVDFNNDGNQDIGLTSQNGANTTGFIEVFMGNGTGTFGTAPTPYKRFSSEVGTVISNSNDFNEDNRPDFVVLNDVSKSFNFLLNATPWISAAGPTTFCAGNSVTLNSKIQENYLWAPNGETTQNITATTSGSYYLTSSVGKTGWCTSNSMNPLTITVTAGPTAPTITASGSTNVCAGGSLVLTSSSATDNLWSTGETTQSITVSTSGNYSCSIVSGGCQSSPSNTITVNVAEAPVVTPTGPVTACSGSITLNSSIGGSFIVWSNGTTTQSNTVTTSGNYFVTYSVPGCPSVNSNTVNVTIGNLATPSISPSGTINFCAGGSVTLTSSSPNFNVWSTGATSQSITVSSAGTYTLHLDDGTCTSGNTTVIVNEISNPNALISTSGPTTFCSGSSVVLTANAGAGLSYQWQENGSNISGQTAQTYTATASGNYTVVVTNSNGCSTVSAITSVTVNPTPAITLGTLTNPTTCGGTDGAIIISGTGTGMGNLTWSGTTSGTATGISLPFTISSLSAGSYSISYTENGCVSNSLSATLNNPGGPTATITPASATTFCFGGSVVLNANTGAGLSYQWQENGIDLSGETSASYTATSSGNYTVVVTQASCPTTSAVTSVTVNALPTATITAGGPTTFCSGSSVVLTANTGAGLSYQWNLNGTALAGETSISYTATTSGIYSVVVTSNGCSTTSLNDTIVVNPTPAITLGTLTNPTTCGGTDGAIIISGTGTGDLTWSGTASGTATGISLPFTISSLIAGAYSISYTENGCVSNSLSATLNNPGGPTATITPASATTFCTGGSVVLNANTGAGLSYQWQENGIDLSGETSASYTATSSGNYTVVVTQAACPTTSAVTSVTVNALPSATITAGGPTTFCSGSSVVLTANAGAGLSYQWNLNGTALAGETSISYTATTSGIYSVVVTSNGCSTTSLNDTIVVNPTPAITLGTLTNPTTCGGTDGAILISGTGTGDLTWSGIASGTATGISLPFTISSLSAGSYSISYTENGCVSNSLSATLNNPAGPTATITPASATTFCVGGSVVLNANTGAGLSYQWQENGIDLSGETSASYTATSSGNYTVVVTQAACPTTSAVTSVTVNALPSATITAGGPTTFCSGDSVVLTANAGAGLSYQWNLNGTALAGETSISYTATTSGIYSVVVTSNGCSTTSLNDTIVVNPTPAITLGTLTNPTTCGGTDGAILISGTGTGDLTWSGTASGTATGISLPFTISSLSAGSYSISYTENGCVSNSLSATLNNPAGPTATITPASATTFCVGGSVVLNANTGAGLSYQWQENGIDLSGETSASYTATSSGNYTVVVTQAACPTTSVVTSVTVNALPSATITAGGPTTFCLGGSVVLTANAGAGLSYQWNLNGTALAGETSISYTATTSGIYSVVVTSNGCSTTSLNDTIVVNPTPAITLGTLTNPTTCGGTDGAILISGTGTGDLTWSGTASGTATGISLPFTISSLSAGSYSISYTENGCVSNSLSATLNNPGGPTATITPASATTFCFGGSVVLNANTGAGLSYQWQENGIDLSGETSASYTATSSGNYTVVVTQAACPTTSAVTSVTVNALPSATITAGGPTTFCSGSSVVLTANAGAGLSYQWNLNGTALAGETSISYTATTSGIYSVVVTSNGCSTTSLNDTIVVNPTPAITLGTLTNPTTCGGTDGAILISGTGTGDLTWSGTASGTATGISLPFTISSLSAGSYSISYTENGCVSNSLSATLNNPGGPTATITPASATTFCFGGSVVLNANTGAGLSYQWQENGIDLSGETSASYTATSSGNYTVVVTQAACPTTSAVTSVTVNTLPSATITAGGPTTFCLGGSVILTANSGAGLSYQWQENGSNISGETSITYTANTAGNYTVVVTNSNGCFTTSGITTVSLFSSPVAAITAASATTFCSSGSVVLNANTGAGLTYQWYKDGSILAGEINSSYTATSNGIFYVVVTNSNSCSTTSNSITVTVNANPTATVSPSSTASICSGGSIVLTANSGSGLSYQWLFNGSPISLATSMTYTATNVGDYQVIVTNSSSCSTTSTITTVSLGASPTAAITAGGATTFCSGNNVILTANTGAGLSYIWKKDGSTIASATSSTYTATSTGNYTVLITNSGGCSTLSNSISVTVNPLPPSPSILNGTTAFFCPGGSVVLNSSSATGNLWSNSLTTPSITVNTPGTYTLSVIDGNGCQSLSSSACNVSVLSAPPVPVITPSGPTTFCAGGSVTLTSSASTNNHWSTTATSNAITVTTSGTYYVYVTNGSGCSSSNSLPVVVTVNPIPAAPVLSASGPTTFCAGQNVVLSSSYSSGNTWSNGNPNNSITVSNSGTYFAFHTDVNGCVSPNSNSITTIVNSNPPVPTITIGGPTTICQGSIVTLTSSSAINNTWSSGPLTQSINVSVSGVYTVTVNNAAGCSSTSAPANITVITTPSTPTISAGGPLTFCEGDSVLLSSSVSNTLWSNGSTDQQIYVSETNVYSAVQVVSGCFSANSNTISVTVNPGPDEPTIVFLGDTIVCEGEDVTLFVNSTSPYIWSTGDTTQVIDVLTTGDYYVTATAPNGCQKVSDTVSIFVVDNPIVNFPFVANTCPLDPPFELNMATPPGGVYTGPGVNTGFFTPMNAGLGNHIITYNYTTPEGCVGDGIQVFEVESCLGIEDNDKFDLSVYPNPTNSLTTINSSNQLEEVKIFDEKGKLIYFFKANGFEANVDLSTYESGIYFISIQFADTNEMRIVRVVKTP